MPEISGWWNVCRRLLYTWVSQIAAALSDMIRGSLKQIGLHKIVNIGTVYENICQFAFNNFTMQTTFPHDAYYYKWNLFAVPLSLYKNSAAVRLGHQKQSCCSSRLCSALGSVVFAGAHSRVAAELKERAKATECCASLCLRGWGGRGGRDKPHNPSFPLWVRHL